MAAVVACTACHRTAPPRVVRLVPELRPDWVAEFPDFEALPRPDVELFSLMGRAWRVQDYRGAAAAGPSPVSGGPADSIYRRVPPALAIHASEPSPACLVSPWIRVLPNSHYTFIGHLRTRDLQASGPIRGTFFLEERSEEGLRQYAFPNHEGSTADWVREVLPFDTGTQADQVRVSACLAGPGGGTGSAWFDDVALVHHREPRLAPALVDRIADDWLPYQWREDVADATRPDYGRDAGWGEPGARGRYRRKIGLGGEVLDALVAPAPTRYEVPVDLAPGSLLRVALGLWNPDRAALPGAVTFRIAFRPGTDASHGDGEAIPLLERRMPLGAAKETGRWQPVEIPLPVSGPGRLVLATEATPGLERAAAAFGDPEILPPAERAGRLVILVSLDTLRADRLGVYGAERPTSPHIDALAARGTVFENAHAPSSWTLPSHGTMLTGLDPLSHGALVGGRDVLASRVTTLGEILQANGFATLGIHGGGFVAPEYGFAQGFDRYQLVAEPEEAVDAAIEALRASHGQDLFLFLHNYRVHAPYREDLTALEALGPRYTELRDELAGVISPGELGSHDYLTRIGLAGETLPPRQLEMVELLYDGGVRAVDRALGRLLDSLAEQGRDRDALIVLTSDHGDGFQEHGLLLHTNSLYHELLHVPLILVDPGRVPAGRRVRRDVASADIVPTLLELLDLPAPGALDGHSLVGSWDAPDGAAAPVPGSLVREDGALLSSLFEGRKYIVNSIDHAEELYELRDDPLETTNVASLEPERLAESRQRLLARLAKLPGLHVVVLSDSPDERVEGSIRFDRAPGPLRSFFLACATCVRMAGERLELSLPARSGPQWINLPHVRSLANAQIELFRGGQALRPRDGAALLAGDAPPGLYVFVTDAGGPAPVELPPEHLEQLEALGYLE